MTKLITICVAILALYLGAPEEQLTAKTTGEKNQIAAEGMLPPSASLAESTQGQNIPEPSTSLLIGIFLGSILLLRTHR